MRPGDVIDGKYQIEVELGEGGMGRVLAASHMEIGSTVAIKVLKAEAMKYPEVPRRFKREARAAGRLRSEHVVRVTDVGQLASGEPYMVMEMLHGCDLASRLKQGPVPPALAIEYIVQACEGLAEAHAMGMVHRDVKPANLFITQRPNGAPLIKLLDFGIATAATGDIDHNLTSTLTVIGSPSYMSPEQLRAARDVDARSDIWSLGVTLYELLTGDQPFVGPTLTALTLKIVGEAHTPIRGVAPELMAIVDRCLAKQREDRFANVAQLAEALAPYSPNGRVAAEMVAGSLSQPVAPTLMGLASSAQMVPPTLYPATSPSGSAQRSAAPWTPTPGPRPHQPLVPSTTSDLGAGESSPMKRTRIGRRSAWIVAGTAIAAGIVVTAIVMTSGHRDGNASTVPAAQADPARTDPTRVDPTTDPSRVGPGNGEPTKSDPTKGDPTKGDPTRGDPTKADPMQSGPDKADPTKADPSTADPTKTDPTKTDPTKTDPKLVVDKPVKQPPRKRPSIKRPKDARAPAEPPDYTKDPTRFPVNEPPKEPVKEPVKDPHKVPCAPNDPRCGL